MADNPSTVGASARPIPFDLAFTMDLIDEEWAALYALASAALDQLRPAEGADPEEHPEFVAWQLVKILFERLERTELRDLIRERLLGAAPCDSPIGAPDASH